VHENLEPFCLNHNENNQNKNEKQQQNGKTFNPNMSIHNFDIISQMIGEMPSNLNKFTQFQNRFHQNNNNSIININNSSSLNVSNNLFRTTNFRQVCLKLLLYLISTDSLFLAIKIRKLSKLRAIKYTS
jgi:hypothetical protein